MWNYAALRHLRKRKTANGLKVHTNSLCDSRERLWPQFSIPLVTAVDKAALYCAYEHGVKRKRKCHLKQWFSTGLALGPTFSHGHQAMTHSYIYIYIYIYILLNKIINATLLFLRPFFMSWTQKAYFSQILFTNLSKSVLVSTSPLPR